jgi:phage tail sheath protein FI
MPEYLHPGVYIEEIERGPKPIEGVPTSTAAFLGETERGPLRPRLVTSYKEYQRWFGGIFGTGDRYMPYAVNGFFENGGKRLYVCRIVGNGWTIASKSFGDFSVEAVAPGAWGRRVWVKIQDGSTPDATGAKGFRLQLAYWSSVPPNFAPYDPFDPKNRNILPRPQLVEDYNDLSVDPFSSDYYEKRLLDSSTNLPVSALAIIKRNQGTTSKPTTNEGEFLDQAGAEDTNPLTKADFEGDTAGGRPELQGLLALELDQYRDVALVYAPFPPNDSDAIAGGIIDHCELQKFRFAVIDGKKEDDPSNLNPRVNNQWDTEYAAFYAPWIQVSDPQTGVRRDVPPGGYVLGVYARSDTERGVFKAPANEVVRGALNIKFDINDNTQDVLNPLGVNAIRRFPDRGIRVWGARTLSSDGLWKYVSVRRLFIFLEHSIYNGTQWVVFEPNDDRLWARVKDTIRLFLRSQWRNGALFGRTEDEAFFITCDRTTMTQDDILNGRLICEIGIAPVRPAEFVVFRIFQYTAEAQR